MDKRLLAGLRKAPAPKGSPCASRPAEPQVNALLTGTYRTFPDPHRKFRPCALYGMASKVSNLNATHRVGWGRA
jgi:hypothetical protein